ncbi:MAG: hypothetical protein KF690_06515 [Bacteroidetes bacterium]|nr:hypothetical protein [Bacteroidota bacterium]
MRKFYIVFAIALLGGFWLTNARGFSIIRYLLAGPQATHAQPGAAGAYHHK